MLAIDDRVLLVTITSDDFDWARWTWLSIRSHRPHPRSRLASRVTAAEVGALLEGDEPVGIPALVLLEAAHVLRGRPYDRTNPDLADVLVELLAHESVVLIGLDADLASAALRSVRGHSARHLADALIGASARDGGASLILTTDARFTSDLVTIRQPGAGRDDEERGDSGEIGPEPRARVPRGRREAE
jgi:predicted nucleic acid-binding protein